MIGAYAAFVLWWMMTLFAFGAMVMLIIDAITFLGGRPDRTVTNTFQKFFGGSKESWRSALFGFIVGTLLTHFTGWGALPPMLPDDELAQAKTYIQQLQDANSNLKRELRGRMK